jgi:cation diffusion facilitator family transporter
MARRTEAEIIRNNDIAVLSMYTAKTVSKAIVGLTFNVGTLISDATHNIADIIQYLAISISTRIARKEKLQEFPVGRKNLESIVGIAIGISLLIVGLQFLGSGLLKTVNAFGIVEWMINKTSLNLRFLLLEQSHVSITSFLIAVIFLGSAIISLPVYFYERKNAEDLDSDAFRADAKELRVDMLVEISLGIGFVFAKIFNLSFIDPIFQVFISFLVIHSSIELLSDNGKNLLNIAIDKEDQQNAIEVINSVEGEEIIEINKDMKLRAYILCKNRIHVEAKIVLSTSNVENITLILDRIKARLNACLAPKYGDVDVSLAYEVKASINEDNYINELIIDYLRQIWSIHAEPNSPTCLAIKYYTQSNYNKTIKITEEMIHKYKNGLNGITNIDAILYQHLRALSLYRLNGIKDKDTQNSYKHISSIIGNQEIKLNTNTVLTIDIAKYEIESLIAKGIIEDEKMADIRKTLESIYSNKSLDSHFKSEAAHLLARSYYKYAKYDIEKARKWFSLALDKGLSSSQKYSLLFQDMLWTDRGNFELQFLNLAEAEKYLIRAKELKMIKGDKYGLAITHSCLANLYSRSGEFDKANDNFQKDLELTKELGIRKDIAHVQCKMADLFIKQALLESNCDLVDNSLVLLKEAKQNDPQNVFVIKGLVKSHIAMWWLNPEMVDHIDNAQFELDSVLKILLDSGNPYLKAIFSRLHGRLEAANENWEKCNKLFTSSAKCFSNLGIEPDIPIQECLSNIEALRWSIQINSKSWINEMKDEINALKSILASIGFKWEHPEIISNLNVTELKRIYKNVKKHMSTDSNKIYHFTKMNSILNPIDKLIWFFEI